MCASLIFIRLLFVYRPIIKWETEISENVFYLRRIMYLRRDLELIRFTESCNFCEFVLKGQGRRLQNLEGHVERIPNKGNVQLEFPRKESG